MRYWVKKVEPLDDGVLWLEFADGKRGTYSMAALLGEGVFQRLEDPELFGAVRTDGFTAVWPGGIDIAPEELYERCVEFA